jgi:hypothetical protein
MSARRILHHLPSRRAASELDGRKPRRFRPGRLQVVGGGRLSFRAGLGEATGLEAGTFDFVMVSPRASDKRGRCCPLHSTRTCVRRVGLQHAHTHA